MSTAAETRARALGDEPMRTAGPTRGFVSGTWASLRDIWAHRELLELLIRRELKARYKDSTLGFLWGLIRPLMMLLVYYLAIGKFLGGERAIPNFTVYVFIGLTAWQLFSEVVSSGTSSIVGNAGLIKKVYVPREVYPLSTAGSALFNFGIQFCILLIATVVFGTLQWDVKLLYVPLAFAVLITWALALAMVLSAANVYLRDVQYLVEISLMILFWASPVVYSFQQVAGAGLPAWVPEAYVLNPVTLAIMGFQEALWNPASTAVGPADLTARLLIALGIGVVLLWLGQRLFARLQNDFAQEL